MFRKVNIKNKEYYVYVYESFNGFKNTVFLIHGWGMDHYTFKKIYKDIEKRYNVICIDLIGFGESDMMKDAFSLDDYSEMINCLIETYNKKYNLENLYLLGHSFGGRVIIKYLNNYYSDLIKGIILCSSAGIKNKSLKKYYKIYKYKLKKKVYKFLSYISLRYKRKLDFLVNNSGSRDYIGLNSVLKQTMSKAVGEDLFNKLKNIKVKTILTWGRNDSVTPLKEAYLFKKEIKNSKLIVFENSGHFPYIDEENKFIGVIDYALSYYFNS